MHLERLECHGFRCLNDLNFEPAPGVNILRGENAQGKTSVLETILFAATSKSHRTSLETELAAHGGDAFRIGLQVVRVDRPVTIEVNWWRGEKRVKVNGVPQTRLSDALGKVRVVFFSPEDIALVKGSAAVRRKFLDMELSQLLPGYLSALQNYRLVLRQRNELLRAHKPDVDQLDAWDHQLVTHGQTLIAERTAFVHELGQTASAVYATIADGESLRLEYKPNTEAAELIHALATSRESDLRRRQTSHGPHRDDLEFTIADSPARSIASQGQQKSAALAVKLAELELVKDRTGEYPILLLDEVLAELDAKRSEHLFDAIDPDVQCILTTTDVNPSAGVPQRGATNFQIVHGSLEIR